MSEIVLALDIGSTKICAIIAETNEDDIKIIGAGMSKAQGLKKGSITNIDQASKSIKHAINDAKRVAGTNFSKSIVSISGAYTKSLNSSGIVNIPNKEIGIKEINRVMNTALYNANIPAEYEVLHALPYNFKVDDQDFIEDPLGMNASRLEVEAHIVTTQKSNLNNLRKAVKASGIQVESIVLSGYASSIAVLNDDEKELGVAVIDLGGSTSNLVVHSGNSIRHNDFLGVGSNHITNDLSMALHTPLSVADSVKITHGNLHSPSSDLIELPVIGDEENTHEVSLEVVYNVIYARVEETLMILAQSIEKSGLKEQIGAGIVLTGGFTKLEGMRDLAVSIFDNMPVRLAKPNECDGLFDTLKDPSYSTAIGLLFYHNGKFTPYEIDSNKKMRHASEPKTTSENISLSDIAPQQQPEAKVTEENTDVSENKPMQPVGLPAKEENSTFTKLKQWISQLF